MGDTLIAVLKGVPATMGVTVAAFVVGCVLGIPILGGASSRYLAVRTVARVLIDLVRGIPPIVWLFIIYFGVAQGAALSPYPAAVIGLGLVCGAYMAEVYRSGMLAVGKGQTEAANALGLKRFQVLARVTGPQALRVTVPGAATYLIGLLKDSAAISIIGVQDVASTALSSYQQSFDGIQTFGLAALVYIALSLPFAAISRYANRWMRVGVAR